MLCQVIPSFTATGGPGNDIIEASSAEGGPSVNVNATGGAGDDDIRLGGNGTRFADGGGGDQDVLRPLPTSVPPGDTPTNLTWTVNLQAGTATPSPTGHGSPITLIGIENIRMSSATQGSPGHTLIGNAFANLLAGSAGNDTIRGFGEADNLQGDFGNDTLEGGDGDDTLHGSYGSDTLTGGPGVDTFWCADNQFDTASTDLVTDNVPGEELHFCPTFPGARLPDALLRRSGGQFVGDGAYSALAEKDQTVSWTAKKGQTRTFQIGLEYDGTGTEPMAVHGCAGNGKFSVKYLDGTKNVTSAVTAGTYFTGPVAADDRFLLSLKIKPKKSKGELKCDIGASSGLEIDLVRADLKVKH
jgi:hypothetical protein